MVELVEYLVKNLVPDGDFSIELRENGDVSEIAVIIAKKDIGKVIGKQGKIAKAIRTVVKAASGRGVRYNVLIEEQPEEQAE